MNDIILVGAITTLIIGSGFMAYRYYKQYKEQQYYEELKKQAIGSIMYLIAIKGLVDLDVIKNACDVIPILKNNIPDTLNKILENIQPISAQVQTQMKAQKEVDKYIDMPHHSDHLMRFPHAVEMDWPAKRSYINYSQYKPCPENIYAPCPTVVHKQTPPIKPAVYTKCKLDGQATYDEYMKWKQSLPQAGDVQKVSMINQVEFVEQDNINIAI